MEHSGRRDVTRGPLSWISLVAVIGPVEPALLNEFVGHYRRQGVERFLLGFHFVDSIPSSRTTELLAECQRLVGEPEIVSTGPWLIGTNGDIRDELRRRAGEGWHVLADVDEFQYHPESVPATVARALEQGAHTVDGLLFDRVAPGGELLPWSLDTGLDQTYSLGAFFTHLVLSGDARKVMVAHSSVELGSGNHHSPSTASMGGMPLPVHHFKWRHGCAEYMRRRAEGFLRSTHRDELSMRAEALRYLAHLDKHGGRIAVEDPRLRFRPVSLHEIPPSWDAEAAGVAHYWRVIRWET
jgi:hypothetical protein